MRTNNTRSRRLSIIAVLAMASTALTAQTYCAMPTFTYPEPICRVVFADIDNTSQSLPDDAMGTEDFTDVVGNVVQGATYTLSAYGHTDGATYLNSIRAYFDWDGNGTFETVVLVGTITGSVCDQEVSVSITVPADAIIGNTRMRLMKKYFAEDPVPNDGCVGGSMFGQAEDYTLAVAAGTVGIAEAAAPIWDLFPNPGNGDITFRVGPELLGATMEILDISGRMIHSQFLTTSGELTLPLSDKLTAGQYVVRIGTQIGRSAQRLIVQ